ncbi:MAG: Trm112 family protein [Acidimicrobiia bacterium]
MPVPEELLEIMACPACHGHLEDRGDAVVCLRCGLHYPVRDDIPVMLEEEAYRPEEDAAQ